MPRIEISKNGKSLDLVPRNRSEALSLWGNAEGYRLLDALKIKPLRIRVSRVVDVVELKGRKHFFLIQFKGRYLSRVSALATRSSIHKLFCVRTLSPGQEFREQWLRGLPARIFQSIALQYGLAFGAMVVFFTWAESFLLAKTASGELSSVAGCSAECMREVIGAHLHFWVSVAAVVLPLTLPLISFRWLSQRVRLLHRVWSMKLEGAVIMLVGCLALGYFFADHAPSKYLQLNRSLPLHYRSELAPQQSAIVQAPPRAPATAASPN